LDPYRFTGWINIEDFARRRDVVVKYADLVTRQVYRHFLLRLPSIYFSRVSRVFEDARVSKPEMDRLIEKRLEGHEFPRDWNEDNVPKSLVRFKDSWEDFVQTIIKEWKTFNIVSALLLSCVDY
jgi:hypothetical protein